MAINSSCFKTCQRRAAATCGMEKELFYERGKKEGEKMSASVCDGISVIRRSLEMSEAAFGEGGNNHSGGTGDSMVPNPPSTPPGPPPPPSKSMKVILNTFQSDLPSYEDATSGSISSSTIKKENSEGKIISTTVNGTLNCHILAQFDRRWAVAWAVESA